MLRCYDPSMARLVGLLILALLVIACEDQGQGVRPVETLPMSDATRMLTTPSPTQPRATGTSTANPTTPQVATATPVTGPTARPTHVLQPVRTAIDDLAQRLGIDAAEIAVASVEPREWPNSCLGAAAKGELCAQVITPGYLVLLEAIFEDGFHSYQYHTDHGTSIRLVSTKVAIP